MKYECHITIDPVFGASLQTFKELCEGWKFKVADLLKVNGDASTKDQFATGHSVSYTDLRFRMIELCENLRVLGYKVRRYKIEEILLDSRLGDFERLL